MKIELVTPYFHPYTGGIETVVMRLAEGLHRRGHTIIVHTGNTYPGFHGILPKEERYKGFLIRRYRSFPFSLFLPEFSFTDRILSLHNYSALMNDYIARRYRKQKKILTPYGTITYKRSQRKYPLLSILYDTCIGKQTLSALDKIVAMTKYEQQSIINKYPRLRDKVITIPGGITIVKAKKITQYTLPKRYFFSIGRIAESKRFEDVLSVLEKFPSYHFVLAGTDTGYVSHLRAIAQKKNLADRFHYIGKVDDGEKAFLMEHASVFIMPSSAEAFSIASVEAFWYSKNVVGARSGGISEIFKEFKGALYT